MKSMAYNPEKHNRRSLRLKGYDYSQPGFYYITICTLDRINRFGDVENGKMILNNAGEMVDTEWNRIPKRYKHVILDKYQIMPNHLHGIIVICRRGGVSPPGVSPPGVSPPSINRVKSYKINAENPDIQAIVNTDKPAKIDVNVCVVTMNTCETAINEGAATDEGAATAPLTVAPTLGHIIGGFKYLATKIINEMDTLPGRKIFQRDFYDHIIRNETELKRIRRYIIENPENWAKDENNPENYFDETDS
jgi:putative transposase